MEHRQGFWRSVTSPAVVASRSNAYGGKREQPGLVCCYITASSVVLRCPRCLLQSYCMVCSMVHLNEPDVQHACIRQATLPLHVLQLKSCQLMLGLQLWPASLALGAFANASLASAEVRQGLTPRIEIASDEA